MGVVAFGLAGRADRVASLLPRPPTPPSHPVENFYEALLDGMRHAQAMKVQGRYDRLEPVMLQSFDVPAMVRFAVGAPFNTLPERTPIRRPCGPPSAKPAGLDLRQHLRRLQGRTFRRRPRRRHASNKDKLVKSPSSSVRRRAGRHQLPDARHRPRLEASSTSTSTATSASSPPGGRNTVHAAAIGWPGGAARRREQADRQRHGGHLTAGSPPRRGFSASWR